MKKLLAIFLVLFAFKAYSQNTTTLPSPTTSFAPSWRYYGSLSDTLRQTWVQTPGGGWNRIYTATEANLKFAPIAGAGYIQNNTTSTPQNARFFISDTAKAYQVSAEVNVDNTKILQVYGNSLYYGLFAVPTPQAEGFTYQIANAMHIGINNKAVNGALIDTVLSASYFATIPAYNSVTSPYYLSGWGQNEWTVGMTASNYAAKRRAEIDSVHTIKGYPFNHIIVMGAQYSAGAPTGTNIYADTEPYAEQDSLAAAAKGTLFIENYHYMKYNGGRNLLYADGIHLSTLGNDLEASHAIDVLNLSLLGNVTATNNVDALIVKGKTMDATVINTNGINAVGSSFTNSNIGTAYVGLLKANRFTDSLTFGAIGTYGNRFLNYDGGSTITRSGMGFASDLSTRIFGYTGTNMLFGIGYDTHTLTTSTAAIGINQSNELNVYKASLYKLQASGFGAPASGDNRWYNNNNGDMAIQNSTGGITGFNTDNVVGTIRVEVPNKSFKIADDADFANYVLKTTTVNGKALSSNITLGLASADFANQGTTTTVLHGNASGNPSFGPIVNTDIANTTIDLTTKVTGVLPIVNGGTGSATKIWVGLTGNETVAGNKTFSGTTTLSGLLTQSGQTFLSTTTGDVTMGGTSGADIKLYANGAGVYPILRWRGNASTSDILYQQVTGGVNFLTSIRNASGSHLWEVNSGANNMTLNSSGVLSLSSFTTAGIVTNNSSGALSTSTALPSGTTAVTQSAGTNNGTVATTAYVDAGYNSAAAQTTLSGSTSGSAVASMPFKGSSYKRVLIYINAFTSSVAQVYTFPTAFTVTPYWAQSVTGLNPSVTVTTTDVTLNGGGGTGWVVIEGY